MKIDCHQQSLNIKNVRKIVELSLEIDTNYLKFKDRIDNK